MEGWLAVCLALQVLLTTPTTTPVAAVQVVDLTYNFGPQTFYWPGNPPFNFTILSRQNQTAGYWYESNSFSTAEHGGTHADAPAHFFENGWRVERIPASHLIGPAVVVNVKAKADADPDYLLSVGDIEDWEKEHGRVPAKSIVIMNSGWGSRYPNASRVFNTANTTNPFTFHFPGIGPAAATFLTTQRDVIAVGVDTPSTDKGQSVTFDVHIILGSHNVLGLENVANLDRLPARGAVVIVGLIKLEDGSGGPARILALVGDRAAGLFDTGTGSGNRFVLAEVLVHWVVLLSCWLGCQRLA